MMQSSTVKVHHRQNHHDNHNHNHPPSHRPRHHQKANKKRQLQQTSSIFGTGSDGDYISRYRHIIYLLIGIFFVSVQLRLLLWGYHASKIPVQGTQHDPLFQNHDRQQQQQPRRRREDAITNARPDPDGYMNGFPIYYQDLTLDPNFHTRPYSQIHCVGENYQHHHYPTTHDLTRQGGGDVDAEGSGNDNYQLLQGETAWMKKSCHYRFLCLNLTSHEFQMYNRPTLDTPLEKWSQQTKYVDKNTLDVSSSVMMTMMMSQSKNQNQNSLKLNGVSLGAIDDDGNGLRWTPTVISDRPPPDKFYTLEDGVVFVPFYSLQGWDLKSLLWDDFFALYNLLHIFQFDDSDSETSNEQRRLYQPLLMRYVPLPDGTSPNMPTTSCDTNQAWYEQCQSMLQKYQSLMMTTTNNDEKIADSGSGSSTISGVKKQLTTQKDVVLQFSKIHNHQSDEQHPPQQTDLVCAKDGVAGIGPLTDHGTNEVLTVKHSHHYRHSNGVRSHNYGRGGVLWRFRRFCLQNLGLETHRIDHVGQDAMPHKMIISKSTVQRLKWLLLSPPAFNTILKQDEIFVAPKLDIEQYDFSTMDVKDSVQAVMAASVFVVDCNDKNDLIMATFLPKGSSLIIYCDENDTDSNKKSNINDKIKKRKERDLLNNLSYVHVHWITTATPATSISSDSDDKELFEQLLWRALQLQTTATAE
mmetsp:Transcript_4945/g.12556  ORF Transcript_4945/g.12556 Transcript_4945/m.12556 type:complete len:693 (+) Transcript_4945:355-2433(+)